jgi:hypothetical protein
MSQKLVYLFRRDNTTNLPDDVYVEAKRRVGSVFDKNGNLIKGLSLDEQKRILPSIIGMSSNDPGWSNAVRRFYAEMSIEVPQNGVELDISLADDGEPNAPMDYVKFRFAANHPHVAEEEDADINGTRYYFYDPKKDEQIRVAETRQKKEAYKNLILVCEDEVRMANVLKAYGKVTSEFTRDQMELELEDLCDMDPAEFIRVSNDKDLEFVALINDCLDNSVLRKSGNTYLYGDEVLGEDQEQAIRALKLKRNSGMLQDIKAKLQAFQS